MKDPLITIGIPTYDRPEGLKRTLNRITNQTYSNLEIVVSDNCSPNNKTELLVKEFMKADSRIQYFKQDINMGVTYNFHFVLSKASANYFIWATDDDYFENNDLIEKLIKHAPYNLLTFTNYNFISPYETISNFFSPIYKSCNSRLDYIFALCHNGWGHPSCGMYNLALLKQSGIELLVDKDLSYHMEGLLLHHIFDTGKIKYVDDAIINYNTISREKTSIIPVKRFSDFLIYTKSLIKFYFLKSNQTLINKIKILIIIYKHHYSYYNSLLTSKSKDSKISKVRFSIKIITS